VEDLDDVEQGVLVVILAELRAGPDLLAPDLTEPPGVKVATGGPDRVRVVRAVLSEHLLEVLVLGQVVERAEELPLELVEREQGELRTSSLSFRPVGALSFHRR
jgi:hypothetical protein